MYVTVIRDGTGRLAAHAPDDIPAAEPDDSTITVAVCPPDAADRTTGTLAHPYQFTTAGAVLAAVPVRAPVTASVDDLNALTVAVCLHPVSHRMFVVGPFTAPDRAEQWWNARTNRFAETGAHCHILPLTAPSPSDAPGGNGGQA
jgi:hypothetical protein